MPSPIKYDLAALKVVALSNFKESVATAWNLEAFMRAVGIIYDQNTFSQHEQAMYDAASNVIVAKYHELKVDPLFRTLAHALIPDFCWKITEAFNEKYQNL